MLQHIHINPNYVHAMCVNPILTAIVSIIMNPFLRCTGAVGYFECSALTQSGLTNTMNSLVKASMNPSGHTSNRNRFTWFRKKRYFPLHMWTT